MVLKGNINNECLSDLFDIRKLQHLVYIVNV